MRSIQAQTASAIRRELKETFSGTKFQVRSTSASMMTAVDIYWTNGPSHREVNLVVEKYQYGSFNSMQDMYEYTNRNDDIPQVKYVSCHRKISDDVRAKIIEELKNCGITKEDDHVHFYHMFDKKVSELSF